MAEVHNLYFEMYLSYSLYSKQIIHFLISVSTKKKKIHTLNIENCVLFMGICRTLSLGGASQVVQ